MIKLLFLFIPNLVVVLGSPLRMQAGLGSVDQWIESLESRLDQH
jgi:hypothetical protein